MDVRDEDEFNISQVPAPFQGLNDDKIATRKRKALFLRQALCIVERFAHNPVTPTMMSAALPWLERLQYDDIAVERNSYNNCGYALCQKPKGSPIYQQYRIVAHTRKVYDTTKRRPFCSDWCFEAAYFVRKQISKEPAWCRFPSKLGLYLKLLDPNCKGTPGKLVLDAPNRLRFSPTNSDSETDGEFSEASHVSTSSDDENVHELEKNCVSPSKIYNFSNSDTHTIESKLNEIDLKQSKSKSPIQTSYEVSNSNDSVTATLVSAIKKRLFEWMTPRALMLLNTKTISNELGNSSLLNKSNDLAHEALINQFYYKYDNMKKLYTKNETNYDVLNSGIIPLIDSISPDFVRRLILWDDLKSNVNRFLNILNVDNHQWIQQRIEPVIHSFNLTNQNTHLKPAESELMSLVLLRLLACTEPTLFQLLDTKCLTKILNSIKGPSSLVFINQIINPILNLFSLDSDDDDSNLDN